jgi:hypothetical protein
MNPVNFLAGFFFSAALALKWQAIEKKMEKSNHQSRPKR